MAKSAHNCHLSRFMPTVMMDCGDKLLVYLLSVVLCVCVCVCGAEIYVDMNVFVRCVCVCKESH